MLRLIPVCILCVAVGAVAATQAGADTIARYNMEDGTDSASSSIIQTEDADVVNTSFITSAGDISEAGSSNNFWHWDGTLASTAETVDDHAWVIQQNHIDESVGSTNTGNDYLTFTLTGTDMDMTTDAWALVISMGMRNTSTDSAQAGFNLQVDVGAGFITIADKQAALVNPTIGAPSFTDLTYDLSGLGDDITTATFRLFATEAVDSGSSGKILFTDTISIITVPTPAALPAGLGLLGVFLMRRRCA